MNVATLAAIDVHVHLEHDGPSTAADQAAMKYFGKSQGAHGAKALADYYRSRNIGCVVFTVVSMFAATFMGDGRGGYSFLTARCFSLRPRLTPPSAPPHSGPPWSRAGCRA